MDRIDVLVRGPMPARGASSAQHTVGHCSYSAPFVAHHQDALAPHDVAIWLMRTPDGVSNTEQVMLQAVSGPHTRLSITAEINERHARFVVQLAPTYDGGDSCARALLLPPGTSPNTELAFSATGVAVRLCQLPYASQRRLLLSTHEGARLYMGTGATNFEYMHADARGPVPSLIVFDVPNDGACVANAATVCADAECLISGGAGLHVTSLIDIAGVDPGACVTVSTSTHARHPRLALPRGVRRLPAPALPADTAATCVVCHDGTPVCTMPACGHVVLCHDCAAQLSKMHFQCPICRTSAPFVMVPPPTLVATQV